MLKRRLKVPPSINQFTQTVDKNTATQIFRLLSKYKPEDKAQKKARLQAAAAAKASSDADAAGPKPLFVKFGLNHVTALIEQKKAQLVIIAHDVDPIEVCFSFHKSCWVRGGFCPSMTTLWPLASCLGA